MKSYKEIAEALKGKQHKIDKNKNGKVDAHDFKLLRKEETDLTEATVKTQKYSWGTMKTVHHGSDFSIPLHPEHHQAISKLKDEQEHKFKDETGRHWVARRKGEHVHFDTTGNGSMKTHVPMHTMHEEYENEIINEEDHAELARKSAAEYRKAIARGDSVAANAANAEHIRHKKAAQVLRKKSHIPGELDESHVEFRIDHREKVSGDHKSTFADHDAKVSDTTDKATYVKVPSHKADAFKSAMKSKHGARVELAEEAVDYNQWVSGGTKTTPKQKPVVEKEPETKVKGSQIKFLNTFKEETNLDEKMNLAKADMGDVIKDFQKSDAPQFAGKTKEKKRQMAIAAKLEADRQQNEGVIQPSGTDAIDVGVDKPKDTVVRDKKGKLVSFKHEGVWKKSTGTVTDKGGAQHTPMSQARHLARSAMKTVKEEVEDLIEGLDQQKHIVHVTVSDPNHTMVSRRKETIQKKAVVNAADKQSAISAAINHYKKQGYKVHDDHYVGLKEDISNVTPPPAGPNKTDDRIRAYYKQLKANKDKMKKPVNEENAGSSHEDAMTHLEKANKEDKDSRDYHFHMANHHEAMGNWHASKGRHRSADLEFNKMEAHHLHALDEAFVNGREYASQGIMHPDHAKLHKVGDSRDFYAHGTGDKISGKVTKNDGKEVHIQADKMSGGKTHKFTVASTLPKQQNEGVNKSDVPAYLRKNDKLTTKDLEKERTQNRSHPEAIKKINGTVQEAAPVAPVPGQKWKDHAVMVNGRQRLVVHRKNIGNYSKEDGWKEVAPGQKVKEDIDLDGNYVSEPMSYQEFAMMIEARAQYMVKATHKDSGRVKVTTYVADKDESEYGVRSRAEREHKPSGYQIDSIRRKDVEAHGEGDEEETVSTQKRGRGRPAGSKSGARGPRIK